MTNLNLLPETMMYLLKQRLPFVTYNDRIRNKGKAEKCAWIGVIRTIRRLSMEAETMYHIEGQHLRHRHGERGDWGGIHLPWFLPASVTAADMSAAAYSLLVGVDSIAITYDTGKPQIRYVV